MRYFDWFGWKLIRAREQIKLNRLYILPLCQSQPKYISNLRERERARGACQRLICKELYIYIYIN